MLYFNVLSSIIGLNCTILYRTVPYYTILYYTILYCTILYYTILYYTVLYYTVLYHTYLPSILTFYYRCQRRLRIFTICGKRMGGMCLETTILVRIITFLLYDLFFRAHCNQRCQRKNKKMNQITKKNKTKSNKINLN